VGRGNTLFESVDIVKQNGSHSNSVARACDPTAFEMALIGVVHRPEILFEGVF
jgi:hypothetical protein